MSRTRLAVWAAVAALLAAWLSSAAGTTPGVNPSPPSAGGPAPPPKVSPSPIGGTDLDREVARMAAYLEQAPRPRPVVRNPFTLASRGSAAVAAPEPVVPDGWAPGPAAAAAQAVPPRVSLAGIAADETPTGPRRTAILSVDGRVVLAQVGDELPGRYRVERIDADGVELFDPGRQLSFQLKLP